MIEFCQTLVSYRQKKTEFIALNNISFTIKNGSLLGVLGHSGAGKSTLLRTINRLVVPTSGEVIVDGSPLSSLNPIEIRCLRRNMGMIFQNFNLLKTKNVYQNVQVALKAIGVPQKQHKELIYSVLQDVGLEEKIFNYPSQLSGGEKQRLGIARALVIKPKYLLCDEITSALDPSHTQEILLIIKKLHQKYNLTVVFITHQIETVMYLCKEVILMKQGTIIHHSSTMDLFLYPNVHTDCFLKSILYDDIPQKYAHVYQLIYTGTALRKNFLLSQIIRKFNIDINIIHAKILSIDSESLGYLYLQILGEKKEQALIYLKKQNILVNPFTNREIRKTLNA